MLSQCVRLFRRPIRPESPLRTGKKKGFASAHDTGSVFFKRQSFDFPWRQKRMYKRISGDIGSTDDCPPHKRFRHLGGDVMLSPNASYVFDERKDGLRYSWLPRHRLQLHLFGTAEIYVCFHCGYPTKSALVAVKEENWDFRMCYKCYTQVVNDGLADVI